MVTPRHANVACVRAAPCAVRRGPCQPRCLMPSLVCCMSSALTHAHAHGVQAGSSEVGAVRITLQGQGYWSLLGALALHVTRCMVSHPDGSSAGLHAWILHFTRCMKRRLPVPPGQSFCCRNKDLSHTAAGRDIFSQPSDKPTMCLQDFNMVGAWMGRHARFVPGPPLPVQATKERGKGQGQAPKGGRHPHWPGC